MQDMDPRYQRIKQTSDAAERWGRTWDPSGARRPRHPGLTGLSITGILGMVIVVVALLIRG